MNPWLEFVRVLIMILLWLCEIYILTQFICSTEAVSLIGWMAVTNPLHTDCVSLQVMLRQQHSKRNGVLASLLQMNHDITANICVTLTFSLTFAILKGCSLTLP